MVLNDTKLVAQGCSNTSPSYKCTICDYMTGKKSSWTKHIHSKKHLNKTMVPKDASLKEKLLHTTNKCPCGKEYKYMSGVYRHKKKCTWQEDSATSSVEATGTKDIAPLLACMTEVMDTVKELMKKNTITGDNNTINNQKIFNVNLFLNEQCANAMSIQDFAKNLHLTMNDLDKRKPDCITNIVIKNLKPLAVTDRPFHCTDVMKSEWYVKDGEKGWEQGTGEKVIETAEHGIRQKWPAAFDQQYPNWSTNDKLQDKYVKLAGNTSSKMNQKESLKVLADISLSVDLADYK
jgi:hypothetical protein